MMMRAAEHSRPAWRGAGRNRAEGLAAKHRRPAWLVPAWSLIVATGWICIPVPAAAQFSPPEGRVVVAIRQQPGDPAEAALDTAEFHNLVAQKAGEPYNSELIRESIKRLYATGNFADIRVDATEQGTGVAVTFLTNARYFIGVVRVTGVPPPPSSGALESATGLELGRPFLEEDIAAVIERLKRELEDEGYFQAAIRYRTERHPGSQQVDVSFDVDVGERAKLGEVHITGTPVIAPQRLLQEAKWQAGKSFTSALVQNGLTRMQNLYRKENYLEAAISIAGRQFHQDTNRVDVDLSIDAGAPVDISVSGASISSAKLRALLPIYQEGTLDPDLLREGERNLRDYFEAQGYFQVQVSSTRSAAPGGHSTVTYVVNLGPRQHLENIAISGNHYFQTDVLRERMRMEPARARLRYGRFSRTLLDQDVEAIRALYQSNGFASVQVRSSLEAAPGSRDGIIVSLVIEEGAQTSIGKFTLAGNHAFPAEQLEGYINAAVGQPYSDSMVATDRNILLTYYWNAGFPGAQFNSEVSAPGQSGKVDLAYTIEEGEPESVGRIIVGGLVHTREGVVNRQVQLRPGGPLSQGQMLETQRRLYDLGIFSRVDVGVQNPASTEQQRNVLVYCEEARRYTFKLGLGADVGRFGGSSSNTTNVEGSYQFSPDISLDLTRLNVDGRPHTVSLRTRFSAVQKRVDLGYLAPRLGNIETLNASAQAFFDETHDVSTFNAKRWEASVQLESKRSRTTTLVARYAFRRVTLDPASLKITPDQIPLQSQPVLVGEFGLTWIRDTRDNQANASQGMFNSVDLAVAATPLGSQASFTRSLIQSSSYYRLGRRLVFARSTQFGVESPFGSQRMVEVNGVQVSTRTIPLPERFYAGGGNSHRGFALNQAGPRDLTTGFAIGGDALLLNSLELRFPIWGASISGVLFHDAGNVYHSIRSLTFRLHQPSPTDFNYMSHAVGIGLRYNTTVAPVRFDVGYNLNPTRFLVPGNPGPLQQTLSRWQFLFSIGQTF
jgi:outer membrane protein insertion porin family